MAVKTKVKTEQADPVIEEMKRMLEAPQAAKPFVEPETAKQKPKEETITEGPEWKKKSSDKQKTTVVKCIVIDKKNHWHTGADVDLKGADTAAYTWGYYGATYPVLVEDEKGMLNPWYLPDAVGESSTRLYKGANPEGFKATFKHRSNMMQKLQIGLMVAVVLGLFFLMYILISH